jgi:membrane protease YdiL (CAAX protease family)
VPLLPVFLDSHYEIRSGWKFVLYSLLLVGLFFAMSLAIPVAIAVIDPTWLLVSRDDLRFLALNAIVLFVPSMGALLVMGRAVERVPLAVFGVSLHKRWLRDVAVGLIVAMAMIVAVIGLGFLVGGVQIQWNASAGAIPLILATVLVMAIAAFNEELVFRGYPLQVFLKGIGPWPAMLLISFLFALLHIDNDGATALSTLNTAIAGIFLSLAYLETRSIWLPWGIHIGWNVGTAIVIGVPVSGIDTASILKTYLKGPDIITGGEYGPENSILGTVVFLAGALLIRRLKLGVSPEIQTALQEHAEKVYIEHRG